MSACLCPSVCKLTQERVGGCRPNSVHMGKRWPDPPEVVKFGRWSNSGCGHRITFLLFLTLWDRAFYDIFYHVSYSDRRIACRFVSTCRTQFNFICTILNLQEEQYSARASGKRRKDREKKNRTKLYVCILIFCYHLWWIKMFINGARRLMSKQASM